jgi:hypothetical protein
VCEDAVHVPVSSVVLHRRRALDIQGRYGFTCPRCDVFVVRHANAAVVDALLAADAPAAVGDLPPWEHGDGATGTTARAVTKDGVATRPGEDLPPLTASEVERFAAAITDDAELAAWLTD